MLTQLQGADSLTCWGLYLDSKCGHCQYINTYATVTFLSDLKMWMDQAWYMLLFVYIHTLYCILALLQTWIQRQEWPQWVQITWRIWIGEIDWFNSGRKESCKCYGHCISLQAALGGWGVPWGQAQLCSYDSYQEQFQSGEGSVIGVRWGNYRQLAATKGHLARDGIPEWYPLAYQRSSLSLKIHTWQLLLLGAENIYTTPVKTIPSWNKLKQWPEPSIGSSPANSLNFAYYLCECDGPIGACACMHVWLSFTHCMSEPTNLCAPRRKPKGARSRKWRSWRDGLNQMSQKVSHGRDRDYDHLRYLNSLNQLFMNYRAPQP